MIPICSAACAGCWPGWVSKNRSTRSQSQWSRLSTHRRTQYSGTGFSLALCPSFHIFLLQLQEMQVTVEGLEKERDFYFGKLRDIEVLCQEHEDQDVIKRIMDILYATEVSAKALYSLARCKALLL
jgi:hypothetical protein